MPKLRIPGERGAAVVAVIFNLILDGGTGAVTMRAIARGVGISVGTLGEHFPSKDYLWQVVAWTLGRQLTDDVGRRSVRDGLAGLLPRTPDERDALAVWSELRAFGLVHPRVGFPVANVDNTIREIVRSAIEYTFDPPRRLPDDDPRLGRTWVMLDGLWSELCRPEPAVSLETAEALLRAAAGFDGEAQAS